jgi:prepilin-type N-terminal cleavage/methylation domain-containing protein
MTENRREFGFTLVEILLGLLISSIIAGGLYAGFSAVCRANERNAVERKVFNRLGKLTDDWRVELGCAYITDANDGGFELVSDENGQVRLAFNSNNVGEEAASEYRKMGRAEYIFVKDQDSDRYFLVKDIAYWAGSKAIGQKRRVVVTDEIEKLKILAAVNSTLSGEVEWNENFLSRETPPRAVKFLIKFEGYEDIFEAVFPILSEVKCSTNG